MGAADGQIQLVLLAAVGTGNLMPQRRDGVSSRQSPVDAQVWVFLFEGGRQRRDGLGHADYQPAARPQGKRERLQGNLLHGPGEIDQHIATQQEIDPREGHALAEVVLAEDNHRPQTLGDFVARIRLAQVLVSKVRWERLQGRLGVQAAASESDHLAVHVRGEYPDVGPGPFITQDLGHDHGQGVGLLSRRATSRPDAQFPVFPSGLRDQIGQDMLAKVLEDLWIAEELGDLDQETVYKVGVLLGIGLEQRRILGEGGARCGIHPTLQSPHDRGRLVGAEVHAAPLVDPFQETSQLLLSRSIRRRTCGREQIAQNSADRIDVARRIHEHVRHRAGHRGELRGSGVLDHHRAARLFHVPGADGAIRSAAGENHRDHAGAVRGSRALEKAVDRRGHGTGIRRMNPDGSVANLDGPIGRHHEDDAVFERFTLLDGSDRESRMPGQDFVEVAGAVWVQMLRDDDRRGEVRRQVGHEARQRLDASRRRSDHNELRVRGNSWSRQGASVPRLGPNGLGPRLDPRPGYPAPWFHRRTSGHRRLATKRRRTCPANGPPD